MTLGVKEITKTDEWLRPWQPHGWDWPDVKSV